MSVTGEVMKISSDSSSIGDFLKTAMISTAYADVILCCTGGQRFSAHRLVLSAASPYLQKVLLTHESSVGQCDPITVILPGVESSDLEAILGFVYTGNTVVSSERLKAFLETAAALEIKIPPIPCPLTLSQAENYLSRAIPAAVNQVNNCKRHCDHSRLDYREEIDATKDPFTDVQYLQQHEYQRPFFPIELFENCTLNLKKKETSNNGVQEEKRQRFIVANRAPASPWCQITRPYHLPRIQPMILKNNENYRKNFIQTTNLPTSSTNENESPPQKIPEILSATFSITKSPGEKQPNQTTVTTPIIKNPQFFNDNEDVSLRESSIELYTVSSRSVRAAETSESKKDEETRDNNNTTPAVCPADESLIEVDDDKFNCNICNKSFFNRPSLKVHSQKHSGEKPFRCKDCGREFSQLRNFKYHRSIHEGTGEFSATCPECGKCFNDRGYLNSHMKIHRNRKEYVCQECGRSFNQRVAYNMHMRIHSGIKPHHCDECGKAFSRKMLLKQHLRTHTGERPYQCHICHKAFADRSNMTLHTRLHSGVKPYQCEVCTKAFTKKHHLKTHLNYHYGVKPYSCPNCSLAFSQSSNMRTHLKKCPIQDKSVEKQSNNNGR